jgi:hypothetical protein
MDGVSIHKNEEAQVVTVSYLKNQQLQVFVSPDGKNYEANIYYDEVLEGTDEKPRCKIAKAIYIDDVPDKALQATKDIITKYLADNGISISKDTKFYT